MIVGVVNFSDVFIRKNMICDNMTQLYISKT